MIVITFAFLGLLLLFSLALIWTSICIGISPMPTSYKVRREIGKLIASTEYKKIFELGSGFGHLAFFLSRHFPKSTIYAFELSFVPFLISLLWKKWIGATNVSLERKDFFTISLHEASLVTCYLFPKCNERLREKLKKELPPGAYVISHTFAFRGWQPIRVVEVKDLYQTKIYLYRM